ncbi:uncharacterized protein LOC133518232 [Cydia pomonella]|uniref:uncharacterized protein LOC133518232 n=1 Tax=Cydia pomonella TaxID=82600 RepID=UPI002ADDA247|nr:uncharacterized protein LOC133518232 [Cydia pomonella]
MHRIYTDGSKHDGGVGAAVIIHHPDGRHTIKRKKLHKFCSVFQAECVASIYTACETCIHLQITHCTVFSDSLSALQEIANRNSTNSIVNSIHRKIHQITQGGTIQFCWIKAHAGLLGNEEADQEAKTAATLHRAPDFDHIPISYIKHLCKTETQKAHCNDYLTSTTGMHLKNWLPTLNHIKELRNKTTISFHLTQILTGHGYHKKYLKRMKIITDDLCPCGRNTPQTIDHLLRSCPKFSIARFNQFPNSTFQPPRPH